MKMQFLLAAAAAVMPGTVLAQDHDHEVLGEQATEESDKEALPEQDAVDHSAHAEEPAELDPHAGHTMPAAEPEPAVDPHAGHTMPETAPEAVLDPHAGHGAAPASALADLPPVAAPPAEAFSGPEHAADAVYGGTAMTLARRAELGSMHGGTKASRVFVERLEARLGDGEDAYLLDGQAWYGGDIDKLWLKVEGEGAFEGGLEGAELQALWSHAIGPWFDLQTGVRYDIGPGEDRGHLVVGVQGLAPYWIELDAAAFLSDEGDLTATVEAEHDMRITQRLILQPRAELSFAAQDIPERGTGAGVTAIEAGLRLRYELVPQFAPYLGVEYSAKLGETADRARAVGDDPTRLMFLIGIRAWF
jgi:copper resistance protein B